jgi:hypothetical protein
MVVLVGYFASALLAFSLIVSNSIQFRWLNIFGCITFIVYGVLINAFPVMIANSILLCINIFQLIKLYTVKEKFEMLHINPTDELSKKFLSFHRKDIADFFPEFSFNPDKKNIAFMVLRDLSIANIFIAELTGKGNAAVCINYTVPKYRDYKVGRFIFEREKEFLITQGVQRIIYTKAINKNHENFIRVMGFSKQLIDGVECYTNSLV